MFCQATSRILLVAMCLSFFSLMNPSHSQAALRVREYDPTAKKPEPILFIEHVFAKKETLVGLAKKHKVKVEDILKASDIKSAKLVKVGTKLHIPTQEALALAATSPSFPPVTVKATKIGLEPTEKKIALTVGDRPVPAPSTKDPIIINADAVPEAIRTEFHAYAKRWIDTSEKLGVGTETQKTVEREGTKFIAFYQKIRKDTVQSEVRKRDYDDTPYVGHVTYEVETYQSIADTQPQALAGPYKVKVEYMREIFSYDRKKKAWR